MIGQTTTAPSFKPSLYLVSEGWVAPKCGEDALILSRPDEEVYGAPNLPPLLSKPKSPRISKRDMKNRPIM